MFQLLSTVAVLVLAIGLGGRVIWSPDPTPPHVATESVPLAWEGGVGREVAFEDSADDAHPPLSMAPRIGETVPRATRDVTPPGITPGPPVSGPLVRIPSPVPKKPRRKPPPRLQRLVDPEIASAGVLLTGIGSVRIAGIIAPQPTAFCGSGDQAWPCGVAARDQLRRFVRGRAIDCEIPPGFAELPETTRCRVAARDIGEWLVRNGWAHATSGAYSKAAEEARAARRGLWGNGRRPNSVCLANC